MYFCFYCLYNHLIVMVSLSGTERCIKAINYYCVRLPCNLAWTPWQLQMCAVRPSCTTSMYIILHVYVHLVQNKQLLQKTYRLLCIVMSVSHYVTPYCLCAVCTSSDLWGSKMEDINVILLFSCVLLLTFQPGQILAVVFFKDLA